MDWTPVVATLAGGLIGTLAETSGRRNARRQADLERVQYLEDQQRQHDRNLRETRERELRNASRNAVLNIAAVFARKTQSHFWTLTEQKYQTTKYSSAPSLSFFP